MSFREFLKPELVVEEELSPEYEVAAVLHRHKSRTVLFNRVRGSELRVAGNVVASREAMCRALGTDTQSYLKHVAEAVGRRGELVEAEEAPVYQRASRLSALPVLKHYEGDAGRYITSGVVIAEDEELGRNASVHRMLVLDDSRLVIRLVERHLHAYYTKAMERGEPLEVAVVIGVHPAVLFASAYPLEIGRDELEFASALMRKPLELVEGRRVGVSLPADAEVVIEGRLTGEMHPEGPFTDITGTYDAVRMQPVIEVLGVYHREDAIYHALLPAGVEHRLFMGMPREPGIYSRASRVARVKQVALTQGGCCWLHAAVAIEKSSEDEPRRVIEAVMQAHPSVKHVVVVDSDIDVFNPEELEFALATRFQAD
ncbi:MAG: UbiD family decarboxylase, partial [Euryarchaeota archaeon]|nr:UbiD family decarboxylase [Euryarchaeota archaeon]